MATRLESQNVHSVFVGLARLLWEVGFAEFGVGILYSIEKLLSIRNAIDLARFKIRVVGLWGCCYWRGMLNSSYVEVML